MNVEANNLFSVRITRPGLERLSLSELEDAGRGILFVPAVAPPRVGSRVRVQVAVDESAMTAQDGLVVWSRPARRGLAAGFRAQLQNPSPTLLRRIKSAIEAVRDVLSSRITEGKRVEIGEPILERASFREERPPSDLPEVEIAIEAEPADAEPEPQRPRRRPQFSRQLALPPPLLLLPGPK